MLSAVSWSGGAAGDWNVAGNWSGLSPGETAPGAADDVTISGNVTVTHGSGSDQVHTLTLGTGATLDVNGGSAITLLLSSGTAVSNDGTINLGDAAGTNSGALFFNGNQTLGTTAGATGIVVLGGSSSDRLIQSFGGQTLTIGGGITIQGDDGGVGGAASTLVNQGTIDADTSGGTINVALGVNGSNSGTIKADSGGSLTVYGSSAGTWTNEAGASISIAGGGKLGIDNNPAAPWTNLGTISTTASTVNLNGAFTQAGLGTFSRDAASTVNLTGKLTGDVALNASTGNWNLVGGELSTGAFSASGATLFATGQGGTLNAETLDSPIDFSTNNGAAATVTGGLSLDNVTLNVGNAAGSSNAVLLFNGDQTLGTSAGATGIVVLGGSSNDRLIQSLGGQTLTIGNGITIRGDDGIVGGAASTLVNHGTIEADTNGGTINVALGVNGSNLGTIKADSGGSLTVLGSSAGTWTNEAGATISVTGGGALGIDTNPADPWTNLGTISTTASTVNLNGAFTQAGLGTFSRDAASTVNLTGKLTGDVALNASTGSWNLVGGELSAGTFSASGATLFATGQGGTLNAETLDSPIDFSTNNGAAATVTGGLSLDNVTLNVGNAAGSSNAVLLFNGDQTLGTSAGATGIVVLGGSSNDRLIQSFGGQTLTIGNGITIRGDDGIVGGAASTLVNHGTIDADTSGGTINVALGANGSNSGTIKADSGGSLTVLGSSAGTWTNEAGATIGVTGGGTLGIDNNPADPWTNLGTISTTASTMNLNGAFTQAGLGTFSRDAASTVNLTGKLTGDVALNASTGSWNLVGGELSAGTFSASGATLLATGQGGTLNAETLDSPIDFSTNNGATATVTGGLSLDNVTLNVGNAAGSSTSVLFFNGDQTLGATAGATGIVVLGGSSSDRLIQSFGGQTLTIGSGVTIEGNDGAVGAAASTLVNQGTIDADTSGGTLVVSGTLANFAAGTLTGGTWKATGGVLLLPQIAIATDAANLIVDGTGASILAHSSSGTVNALAGLSEIGAGSSLALLNGATLTTNTALTNNGTLTVGVGSTLTLQGSYSQASTATLDEQIGGTSASGQFGRLVASGNSSGAALAGTLTASLANGFSPGPGESFQLITTGAGSGLTGTFGSVNVPGLGGGLSLSPHYNANNFTLATNSPPGPTSLVFSQQPSVTTAGDAIDSPTGVQVEIVDQFGHVLSGDNSLVTINIASGPAGQSFTATSTLSAHAVNGVATFGNLILDGAGTYKLSAADATDSLSDFESTSFTVSPAGASELVFTAQPTTTIAGQTINGISGVQVSIKDSFGNLETGDTSQVTFGIASPLGGAFASGTFTQLAVAGVATFGNLVIDAAGSYKLSAADATDSLSGFDSTSFNIDPAGASQLVFTAQPTTTTAGQTINGISGVQVSIKDSFGNLETGDTSQVTVGIASPPGGAFASGTFTQPAVAGVATFGNLVVDAAGSYKLSAADATHSLSGFESDSFAVNPAVSGHSATYLNGQAGDGTAATLIDNLYRELLGREPEPQGQAFWVADYAQLAAGNGAVAAQHQLVLRFLDSPEYWQHLVAGMYHDFLRRAPDSQGLQFWTAVLASGADEENVLAGIVGSDEYFADAGGTDSGFVGSLYRDLLGRSGDSSGIAFWTRLFTSPLPSFPPTSSPLAFRTALVQTFLSTPEAEHKLLNGDFPAAAGSVGAPGTPAVGAYGLADITGNGWDNLYFQGDLAASAVDALFAGLQDQPPYNDVIAEILGMPHYF